MWWDVMQDIIQKDIRKVGRRYERNERLYRHKIFQMEKVIPSFQYELLVFIPELETLDEEEEKGNIDGVGSLGTKIEEEEPVDFKGGKYSPHKEVKGMTYALEQTLKPIESIYKRLVHRNMHM